MKKLLVIAAVLCSLTSCIGGHLHTYLLEERGTKTLLPVTEWADWKVGQIVEEGRGIYVVVVRYK